jgi:hypothetical protein
MRAASWSRGRWWRCRPALRGRGRGGRRRRSGGDATGRRRGRVSGAFPAKRRADRGRGSSCEAEDDVAAAMPKMVVEVADRYTARRDGRPNNSGEADVEVRGDVPAKPRAGRGGGRCGVAEGGDGDVGRRSGAATGQPEEMSTRRKVRPARATVFRRCSGEEEVIPGMRAASRSRGRWWRRQPALRQGDRGGWRRPARRKGKGDGGNAAPGVSAGNGGQAGEEEAAAMLEEATARPADVLTRRQGRLKMAGGTGERGRRRGGG